MNKRYIGAMLLLPFLIFLIIGGPFLRYGLMVLSIGGMYEFYKACKKKKYKPMEFIGYAMCLIYYITLRSKLDGNILTAIIVLALIIMLCIPVIKVEYSFIDIAITLLGFVYVSVFFSLITLVNYKSHGVYLLWLVFISSWLCDTTAYYAGRFLGKKKLCPKVSPNKTIAGSIGGLLGSTAACTIFGIYINNVGISISIIHFVIIGLLCGVFCQFGDLIASSIKRYVDLKDYSNLIPGHGGILDRFDSILFSAVIVYYYITLIIGM